MTLYFEKNILIKLFILFCIILISSEKVEGKNSSSSKKEISTLSTKKSEAMMNYYINMSTKYTYQYELSKAKTYLDSAAFYRESVKTPEILGFYHSACGDYYLAQMNDVESHKNYYRAIDYYEKADKKDLIIPIFHNLAFSYIQKKDTESLKKIIDKMISFALKKKDKSNLINTYRIIAFYHNCLYDKNDKQTIHLDSAIFYDKQVISFFETEKSLNIRNEDIAYNYINLSSNMLKKKEYNSDSVDYYIKMAEELSNPSDTAMIVNCLWVKGEVAFNAGNLKEAEQIFKQQLSLMDEWLTENDLNMHVILYDRLSKISEARKDHIAALYYERKKSEYSDNIHDTEKYEIIRELETKYEVKQKDERIKQLQEIDRFREKINLLYFGICILAVIMSFFLIRWMRSKKKAADSQLQLTLIEKDEVLLQTKLKEEQLKKVQLEKYEALLDSHFKDIQLSGMDDVLDDLKKEQIRLNRQIENYAEKFRQYEKNKLNKFEPATSDPYFSGIVTDVYDLINKRLASVPERKEYTDKLRDINDHFFGNIKKRYPGDLTVLNMKYCICFAVEMDTRHIADCFSVEPRSIHMVRHRLRTKFNVNKDIDLDLFLKQMMNVSP